MSIVPRSPWTVATSTTEAGPSNAIVATAGAGFGTLVSSGPDAASASRMIEVVSRSLVFQNPAVSRFLSNEEDKPGQAAEAAYRAALRDFQSRLSDKERNKLRSFQTIQDVFSVVNEARVSKCSREDGGSTAERVSRTLNVYAKSIDIIVSSNPEYAALLWGSMRFLLQVSLNYFDLFTGLSNLICGIGDNLERFEMYLHAYPTARMKAFSYRLYAIVIAFFKDAILFYKQSRWKKLFTAFWSPFDAKFKDTIIEIERLVKLVEQDAVAVGMLQMQQGISVIAEWALGADFRTQLGAEFQRQQAPSVLAELRQRLFLGREIDATYHEDMMNLYSTTSCSDWDQFFAIERKAITWGPAEQSNLIHMQTDLVEPQLYRKWICLGQTVAGKVPFAHLIWSPSMTAVSALASIIFQILQQRPDVLQQDSLLSRKLKAAQPTNFDEMWNLFQELLNAVPGLLCYITIGSIGPQEEAFATKVVEMFDSWSGNPVNLQLVTPLHPSFPKPQMSVDIDAEYDVSPDLDSPDNLHHVVLAELGLPRPVSKDAKDSLWQSMWRTVCYSVNAIVARQLEQAIHRVIEDKGTAVLDPHLDPDEFLDWLDSGAASQLLRAKLQHCIECLPFMLPSYLRTRFEAHVHAALREYLTVREGPQTVTAPTFRTYDHPRDMHERQIRPTDFDARQQLWGEMRQILNSPNVSDAFAAFIPVQLRRKRMRTQSRIRELSEEEGDDEEKKMDSADRMLQLLDDLFSGSEWRNVAAEAGYTFRQAVTSAIELGLNTTVATMFA
ncbi:MAG: hypothetical protein M1823_000281 [Watsoniomyces obsoletus]|nr:MAG: hypothetical protein M1823_000281 [Watsoniomyces obsoletus]